VICQLYSQPVRQEAETSTDTNDEIDNTG